MALTTYTASTDIIKTLGTNPEDRPTLTDDTFKAKFDENAANIAAFLNAMITELASVSAAKGASCIGLQDSDGRFTATQVEAALAEIAGSGRTTETVKGLADLISTNDGKLTTFKAEAVSQLITATRDISLTTVQTITGLTALPKRIELRAYINSGSGLVFDMGSWEANGNTQSNISIYNNSGVVSGGSNFAIATIANSAAAYATGTIQNVTASQFEIAWVKTGSPTGTINLQFVAHYH